MAKIRKFKPEDSEGARQLILSILRDEYPFDRSAYEDSDINDISRIYGGKRCAFYVIEEDKAIAGTVGIKNETEKTALLRRFFVDPKRRKKGYGTLLLKKAIDFGKKNGYKEIVFRATDRMENAIKLCKKFGFKEVEKLPLAGFHIHKLLMEL